MQGTHCISGSGIGICILTGDHTIFGKIAKLSAKRRTGLTSLQKEILRFVLVIVSAIAVVSIVVIVVWATWLRRDHPDFLTVAGLIVSVVSVSVAFIPEGIGLPDVTEGRSSHCGYNVVNYHRPSDEKRESPLQKSKHR